MSGKTAKPARRRIAAFSAVIAALALASCLPSGEGSPDGQDEEYPDGCHTDCNGGFTCLDGVVTRYDAGAQPCELGSDCNAREVGQCPMGCTVVSINEYERREYASGENGWRVMCDGLPAPDASSDSDATGDADGSD